MSIQVLLSIHTFFTETEIGFLFFSWLQMLIVIQCLTNWLSDISFIIITSCATFNGTYCQQLTRIRKSEILPKWMTKIYYSQLTMFVYDLHDYKLWARWQEPALDKASDLRVIHISSSCETLQHHPQWNISLLMVRYIQVWNRILSQNIYMTSRYRFMECVIPREYQWFLPCERDRPLIATLVYIVYWVTFW